MIPNTINDLPDIVLPDTPNQNTYPTIVPNNPYDISNDMEHPNIQTVPYYFIIKKPTDKVILSPIAINRETEKIFT